MSSFDFPSQLVSYINDRRRHSYEALTKSTPKIESVQYQVGNFVSISYVERPGVVVSAMTMVSQEMRNDLTTMTTGYRPHELTTNQQLSTAAYNHAGYMAEDKYIGHWIPRLCDTLPSRVAHSGYTGWTFLGESLVAGVESPADVIDAMMANVVHRSSVLNPYFNEIGVGYYFYENETGKVVLPDGSTGGPYNHYWSILFGRREERKQYIPSVLVFQTEAILPGV